MRGSLRTLFAVGSMALFTSAVSVRAEAGLVDFDLNYNFGTVNAGGDVLVTITDAGGNVTISVTNNTQGFIKDLYLNYSPSADLANATILNFSDGSFDVTQPSVNGTFQGFAIDFRFQTANNNPGRFEPGESITFDLDATADLTAAGFNHLGGGPTGDDYYAAAHVNAVAEVGSCGGGSAKVGDANGGNVAGGGDGITCGDALRVDSVPEPTTLALLGIGVAGLAASRRRKPN